MQTTDSTLPKGDPHPNEERYFITALARGLEVLACFKPDDQTLSNQQIAERCNLPKSTVTRITFTLTRLGYLAQATENGGRFSLGVGIWALGSAMLNRMDVRQIARPMMQEVADFANAAVSLAVRDRMSMIYVEVCRSSSALGLTLQVGSRIPLATSAIGRAYLTKASETERNDIFARVREFDEAAYCQLRREYERGVEDYRKYGCATSFGEWQPDVNGISIGFFPAGGPTAMAINSGGLASQLSPEFLMDEVRPRLQKIVQRIAA